MPDDVFGGGAKATVALDIGGPFDATFFNALCPSGGVGCGATDKVTR